MRYDTAVPMNSERTITGRSAFSVIVGLVLLSGCSGGDAPKTGTGDRRQLSSVASDHGLTPYYYGLVEEYQSVLAGDPDNIAANIGMGNALYEAGQWREAITYYDRALRLDPHNADVITDKGTCYRNLGMYDAAVREYQTALRIDPAHQNALYSLGILYSHDKKNLAKAIEYWNRLLDIAPKHPQADQIHASLDNFRRALRKGAP